MLFAWLMFQVSPLPMSCSMATEMVDLASRAAGVRGVAAHDLANGATLAIVNPFADAEAVLA